MFRRATHSCMHGSVLAVRTHHRPAPFAFARCSRHLPSTTKAKLTEVVMPSSLPQMATEEEDAQSFADCVQEMYEDGDVAKSFFKSLAPETRAEVLRSMKEELEMARHESKAPGREQLFRLALLAGLPMIGFGFMDNAIMIVAGDYLDTQFCYHLGLSTLFAAALGNVVSDVAGVATAGPIETLMRNLGMKGHGLTPGQLKHPMVLSFKYLGTAVGVAFGCFIGMFPLLWPKEFRLWPTREDIHLNKKEAEQKEIEKTEKAPAS